MEIVKTSQEVVYTIALTQGELNAIYQAMRTW